MHRDQLPLPLAPANSKQIGSTCFFISWPSSVPMCTAFFLRNYVLPRRKPPKPPEFRQVESRFWAEAISKFGFRSYCGLSRGIRL